MRIAIMRPSRLLGATVLSAAVLGLALPAVAQQQPAPFSFSLDGATAAPAARQSPAGANASEAPPQLPRGGATNTAPASSTSRPGARPFDINGDGRAPPTEVVDEEQEYFGPSTTTSPLSAGRPSPDVLPLDAISQEQRRELQRVLKEDSSQVRELRVNVENDQDWIDSVVERPIVPFRTLRLDGEIDYRSWSVFLTAAEAARGGTLSIAFTNSVLVLPEASRLRVYLNGRQIAQTAIDSPDRTKVIALPVSSQLLRPGENALRIETDMRHRIDCSIQATYELWTRIDTRLTGFTFEGGRIPLSGINDLGAVGVGTNGATRLRIYQEQAGNPTNIDRMLRAVQSASLRGRFAQPLVEVVNSMDGAVATPGILNIIIGPYEAIRGVSNVVPREGALGPVTALVDDAEIGPTLVITGPGERDVDAALARFDAPEFAETQQSPIAAIPPWMVPDSVRVNGADTVTLRDGGVETINFSGRHFTTHFSVTLPPDFYAAAYGEALLLLDAAYSSEVEPGSRLTVSVNGVLSTAISFTSSAGEVFDSFPIVLSMQSFRPGINEIEIVADLNTPSDRACLPGGTVPQRDRFALFSSTRLVFPNFARIGQLPNLASFATNGFPYPLSAEPVRVHVAGPSNDTIGATGTLLARVAASRGAPLRTNVVEEVAPFGSAGMIVVGALSDVSNLALDATGASRVIPSNWLQPYAAGSVGSGAEPEGLERYDDVLRRLRQQLRQEEIRLDRDAAEPQDPAEQQRALDQRNETLRTRERWAEKLGQGSGVSRWINQAKNKVREAIKLNITFGRNEDALGMAAPMISENASLVMAQGQAPDNPQTAWTLVTAPSPALLSTSMAAISSPDMWDRIGGRITAYDLESNSVEVVPVDQVSYLATLPLSFGNLRLIAANWFSINNGVYAIALVAVGIFLGFITWVFVTPLGRRNKR
ncbi:cellulose biosynthesis cyclic di-GMP-binding regulatory protein BcsB [Acuticoccus sp. M5D2P5]|uniref:cellulose biosynthesis cyclic di-GMP-binding regulatory protein BcsB n=1 Tax=Acuticoccus kalidii TaxID=2910977 RepID=UPI001F2CBF43|nr:cellulose biosynthesis cyclic di-GMP-binding regulatory protein BcsB [Acuticoccus kalidii]MCF3931933.1 cellulose biosynthesis cyclic di-GMP-binding regulatory protein BcsB [Acuticoccus kalidii]